MRALKVLASLCSCVDTIEHSVAHNFDKIFFFKKNLMCWHISLSIHVSLLLDQASSNRFEFGSGRFSGYSCTGVNNVLFGY